ncbi:MAG: signal peptidase II [Gemmatimonadaceae bacterium]|nr:signal peptidase II [Gemmatimonadaceae bacterium]
MNGSPHLTQLSRIALLVAVGDLATKAAAERFLSDDPTRFSHWLHFAVVHNTEGAFGWSAGVYTWQLNLALTLAGIVFMIPVTRDLAKIDEAAPRALGLIVGGALGNLASLIFSAEGVVDFIVLQSENFGLVLNVADVAAYAGLAMILRTGVLVVAAMRREGRTLDRLRITPVRSVFAESAALKRALALDLGRRGRRLDREVSVVDWNDRSRTTPLAADAPPGDADSDIVPIGDVRPRKGARWLNDSRPRELHSHRGRRLDGRS